jgi:short-subunit dehydrogenase
MRKNCWIIGASHGIGEDLARKFYRDGYDIAISARSSEKLERLKKELLDLGLGNVLVSVVDVSNLDSVQKSFAETLQNFQKIDLIIFCPALYQPMSITNFDLEISKKIIDVNLVGFLNFLHLVVPQMIQQKSGQISVIASVAGYIGLPQSFAYGASKAALINLCEGIYLELRQYGINLSVINPGFVKTRLTDQNKFQMPFLISSKKAAELIFQGLKKRCFEIHFPKKFTLFLKILRLLPYKIFFFIIKKIV